MLSRMGTKLHFERVGSGEPLVLIHGIGSRSGAWKPVLDRLARERQVYAIDLPGFAQSPPLDAGTPSNVLTLADAVEGDFSEVHGLEHLAPIGEDADVLSDFAQQHLSSMASRSFSKRSAPKKEAGSSNTFRST